MKHALLATLIFCLPLGPVRCEEPALDPLQPYSAQRANPVTYEVDFSVVVTPPYKAKKLAVWLPVPPSNAAQEVTESRFSTFPMRVEPKLASEEKFGNRFAYFEFTRPQGAQVVRHRFRIQVWELRWNLDLKGIAPVAEWPASFEPYLQSDSQAVVFDARFQQVLDEIVPRDQQRPSSLGDVLSWVEDNFQYDHHDASLRASAEHGLTKHHGHCSDYHSFCASLGRALGVPTRVTYGINPFPKNSPSHCKLEAYLAPHGWVSFDVSETQKLLTLIRAASDLDPDDQQRLLDAAQARLMSGFRDNTWFLQTVGTDYDLAPVASQRVPVVRTAWIEADGVPLADPDPADTSAQGFTWMTVHDYKPDHAVPNPFSDFSTLTADQEPQP